MQNQILRNFQHYLSQESYLGKTVLFRKFKSLRSHNKKLDPKPTRGLNVGNTLFSEKTFDCLSNDI